MLYKIAMLEWKSLHSYWKTNNETLIAMKNIHVAVSILSTVHAYKKLGGQIIIHVIPFSKYLHILEIST